MHFYRSVTLLALVVGGSALGSSQWLDGVTAYSYTTNCITGQQEILTDAFVSFFGDPSYTSPAIGDVYYLRVVVADTGDPCAGGSQVDIEVTLPPSTSYAIDATNKVRCFLGQIGGNLSEDTADCPQTHGTGTMGDTFDPTTQATWPLAHGNMVQVWIPVVTTAALHGIASNSYFTAHVHSIDGVNSPWTDPQEGVWVADAPTTIIYPTPSATQITTTTVHMTADLYSHYRAGNGYFDYGLTTGYGTIDGPAAVPNTGNAFSVYADESALTPNTLYHWRLRFVDSTGATTTGADQTFTTANGTTGTQYTLSLQPVSGGTVSASPSGFSYAPGTSVSLTATPAANYTFVSWVVDQGAPVAANPTSVVMNQNHLVAANFAASLPVTQPDAGGSSADAGGLPPADGGHASPDSGSGGGGGDAGGSGGGQHGGCASGGGGLAGIGLLAALGLLNRRARDRCGRPSSRA